MSGEHKIYKFWSDTSAGALFLKNFAPAGGSNLAVLIRQWQIVIINMTRRAVAWRVIPPRGEFRNRLDQYDRVPGLRKSIFWRTIACYSLKSWFVISRQSSLASFRRSLMLWGGFLSAWHLHKWKQFGQVCWPIRGEKSWFSRNPKNPPGTLETFGNTHLGLWKKTGPSRAKLSSGS